MTENKIKSEILKESFDKIADVLRHITQRLENLEQLAKYEMDKQVIRNLVTELYWATENCTVIGLHQVDKKLEDDMGTDLKPE